MIVEERGSEMIERLLLLARLSALHTLHTF